jgi:queuosine precursor transporter
MKGRALWVRAIGSSLVGELLDSLAFVFFASLTGVFGWELFVSLVLTNYLFKLSVEVLVFPLTFLAVKKLKKVEEIDTYDVGVKLNPFK